MKTHFCPYPSKYVNYPACGTEETENTVTSTSWDDVTCLKCLKNKEDINNAVAGIEESIVKEMGDFVDFMNQKGATGDE